MSDLVVEASRVVVSWRNSWGWVTQYAYQSGLSRGRVDVSVIGHNSLEVQDVYRMGFVGIVSLCGSKFESCSCLKYIYCREMYI